MRRLCGKEVLGSAGGIRRVLANAAEVVFSEQILEADLGEESGVGQVQRD